VKLKRIGDEEKIGLEKCVDDEKGVNFLLLGGVIFYDGEGPRSLQTCQGLLHTVQPDSCSRIFHLRIQAIDPCFLAMPTNTNTYQNIKYGIYDGAEEVGAGFRDYITACDTLSEK
jgi:hypothetical protein